MPSSFVTRPVNEKLSQYPTKAVLAPAGRGSGLDYEPESLIAALWLQLARAMSEGTRFTTCAECRAPFPVVSRREPKFCSDACRFKAYRGRQKRAQELQGSGVSLGEIAGNLHTDVKTVEGWVKK